MVVLGKPPNHHQAYRVHYKPSGSLLPEDSNVNYKISFHVDAKRQILPTGFRTPARPASNCVDRPCTAEFQDHKKPVYVKKKKLSEQQNLRHSLFKKAKPALNERSECTGNIQNTVLSSRA
jgi:hypothetical protein